MTKAHQIFAVLAGVISILWPIRATAQVVDQIVVTSADAGVFKPVIRRFDRRLNLLGSTPLSSETSNEISSVETSVAVLPNGDIWLPIDPLNQKKLVRMNSAGVLLPTVVLGDYPVQMAASGNGLVYALTRLPLLTPTPLYAVDFGGSIQWSNPAGPTTYTGGYPDRIAVASNGDLWIGDITAGPCACLPIYAELTLLDPTTGDIIKKVQLPKFAIPPAGTILGHIAANAEGRIWVTSLADFQSRLHLVGALDAHGIVATFPILGSYNGATNQVRVDAQGDIWVPGSSATPDKFFLYKYSQVDGSLLSSLDMGGIAIGYALGSSGEELFAVASNGSALDRRIVRVNLVTGRKSTRVIDPPFTDSGLGNGDPTGFIWANVLDQGGDNDGDGAANREETLAGTSPYDPTSRPQGPKIYIDFAQSNNAIILKLSDPDGLLNPTAGLSVPTLSVKVGPYGEIFPILLQFLTFVQISPDQTQATAFFGALPFATGSKLTVDASVADKTGAVSWDWQVTPPGDL